METLNKVMANLHNDIVPECSIFLVQIIEMRLQVKNT